jgi:hypothetical protein
VIADGDPSKSSPVKKPLAGLPLLYKNLSAGYVLGGVTIASQRDPATLEELSKTGEAEARQLATLRLNLDRERQDFNRNVANTLDPQQVQTDMFLGLVQGKGLFDSGGPGQKVQQRITANAMTAVKALEVEKQIRAILNRFLASRPATPLIGEKDLTLSYRVQNRLDVMLAIENRTGRTLRDCVVITEAKVDVAKINQAKLRIDQGNEPAYGLMTLFGIDQGVQGSTRLLEEARWEYERSDKGSVIFVPEWKSGVRLETALSPIRAAMYAESAEVSIWSADGHLHAFLSHEKIADAVNQAFPPRQPAGPPNDDDPNGQCQKCGRMFNVAEKLLEHKENVRCPNPRCRVVMSARRAVAWRDVMRARQQARQRR